VWCVATAVLAFAVSSHVAQAQGGARPSPQAAAALLQSRPDLVAQLRDRMATSGMSPDQVRARLKAEGYPENLLDAYLTGGNANGAEAPSSSVFAAVRALGIVDAREADDLMAMSAGRALRTPAPVATDADASTDATLSPKSAELFGMAMFREETTRFQANVDGPVDAGYKVGPGDELVLILTGDVELAHTLEVTRGGFVVIPQVGQLGVANLTLGQLEDVLYARLGRAYSGVRRGSDATTRFSISVSRLRSNQVFVVGDVVTPGSYRVSSAGSALTALYAAGGPSERGSLRAVQVRRGGAVVATFDVYDYLLRGDASKDVRLQQGDVLFVPVRGARVRVDGEVTRAATYELKAGEQLADVLGYAGGLKATAGGRRVLVDRILPRGTRAAGGGDRASLDVALAADGSAPALAVLDGDVVQVPRIADRVRNRIVVNGHVWSPGAQGFTRGLTLEDALKRAGGVKPDAYLGRVLVSRLQSDSTRVQLRAMLRDSTGATVESFVLQDDDEITTYSRTAFRPDRYVAISGAVQKGGRFAWREGMTLRDLVLQAGGLSEQALLGQAEIARPPEVRDEQTLATTVRVPLDSGYLFAEGRTALAGAREELLRPYDNVLIFRDPARVDAVNVQVRGEVRFPGTYTMRTRTERLSDVIERAGGFTQQGDTSAVYYSRLTQETEQVAQLVSRSSRRTDSLGRIIVDTAAARETARFDNAGRRVRVGVDVAEALRRRDTPENLFVANGDSLYVPAKQQTVTVRGEVNSPTALVASGKKLRAYLLAAGGATNMGKASAAYVIQPNGKIESRTRLLWLVTLDPTPKPGATVVVPAQGEQRQGSLMQTIVVITQTLTALATVVVLAR
jgi:protein involved in polysaccharide export with SLBB domain